MKYAMVFFTKVVGKEAAMQFMWDSCGQLVGLMHGAGSFLSPRKFSTQTTPFADSLPQCH
jgi:hypothetical protein